LPAPLLEWAGPAAGRHDLRPPPKVVPRRRAAAGDRLRSLLLAPARPARRPGARRGGLSLKFRAPGVTLGTDGVAPNRRYGIRYRATDTVARFARRRGVRTPLPAPGSRGPPSARGGPRAVDRRRSRGRRGG